MKIKQGYYVDMNDFLIIVYANHWEFYFEPENRWSGTYSLNETTDLFYKLAKWEFIDEL